MRFLLALILLFICLPSSGQQFVFPDNSAVYADTFAVWLRPSRIDNTIVVSSGFGDIFYETITRDSIIIFPYYSDYDNEKRILVKLDEGLNRKTHNRFNKFIELAPAERNDSIEASILRVLKTPDEKNLRNLALRFEKARCFANALFVYYRLYHLGYPRYWEELVERIRKENAIKAIHR